MPCAYCYSTKKKSKPHLFEGVSSSSVSIPNTLWFHDNMTDTLCVFFEQIMRLVIAPTRDLIHLVWHQDLESGLSFEREAGRDRACILRFVN